MATPTHHEDGPVCMLCERKLLEAHDYLACWFREKKVKYVNLHISWSFRGEADQEQAFRDGKTHQHWPNSAHNHMEDKEPRSMALDLFQIDEDGVARFSQPFYAQLDKENTTDRLPIFWGGKWKSLGDSDHFEYQEPQGSV